MGHAMASHQIWDMPWHVLIKLISIEKNIVSETIFLPVIQI